MGHGLTAQRVDHAADSEGMPVSASGLHLAQLPRPRCFFPTSTLSVPTSVPAPRWLKRAELEPSTELVPVSVAEATAVNGPAASVERADRRTSTNRVVLDEASDEAATKVPNHPVLEDPAAVSNGDSSRHRIQEVLHRAPATFSVAYPTPSGAAEASRSTAGCSVGG